MTKEEALETWLPVVEIAIVDANIPEAKEALEMAIKALEQEPEWIPVSERLPEKYTYTLWSAKGGYVKSDYFNGEFWKDAKKYGYEVTAWMPLPQSYKASPTGAEGSDKK